MFSPKSIVAIVLSFLAITAFALHYFVPAPPKKIVIATGGKTGQYFRLGNEYKAALEKNGIQVEVLVTKGSIENLELLNDSKSHVDLAFVQSGTATSKDYPQIQSLAGVFYEPLWIVYREKSFKAAPDTLDDLVKKNVSIVTNGFQQL
jgi:TRAP-type uncharacterized transport system substrate-binding protein